MSNIRTKSIAFEFRPTDTQGITADGWRLVTITSTFDKNTAGFTESSDVFTCTIPGLYLAQLVATNAGGSFKQVLALYKNGSEAYRTGGSSNSNQTWSPGQNFSVPVQLAVGDTFAFYAYSFAYSTVLYNPSPYSFKCRLELIS